MRFINPYFRHEDNRGIILGITQGMIWKEVNFVTSKKGTVRGGHYHKKTVEGFFVISGKIKVYIKNLKNNNENTFLIQNNDIFIIEPYEWHKFEILEDAEWINMLSEDMRNSIDIFK